MSTNSKGAEVERKAIAILAAQGYHIHRCVRTGTFRAGHWISQSNDVFGCVDIIAKKIGERTRWVQVTMDSGIGRKKDDLSEVPWDTTHDSVEVWRWIGGRTRKHKTTGATLDAQYFQVYRLDEGYELKPENKVRQMKTVTATQQVNE